MKKTKNHSFSMIMMIIMMLLTMACPVMAEQGKVSWYSGYKRTANGERFNPQSMTAAHKRLPFGTMVRATRTDTGSSAVFRINNRGPFIRGRILDVTPAGASALGLYGRGVAPIKLEVIGSD